MGGLVEWLNWERQSASRLAGGSGFPIYEYRAVIGTDPSGVEWLVSCRYYCPKKKFLVEFDSNTVDDDGGCPFLRTSVAGADDFWAVRKKVHHTQFVDYEDIQDTINKFVKLKNIEHFFTISG